MIPILVVVVLWLVWSNRDKLPTITDVFLHQRISPIKPGSDGTEYLPDIYLYGVRYENGQVRYAWTREPLVAWDALRPVEEWPGVSTDLQALKAMGWDSI
jgi:hypothetical protein